MFYTNVSPSLMPRLTSKPSQNLPYLYSDFTFLYPFFRAISYREIVEIAIKQSWQRECHMYWTVLDFFGDTMVFSHLQYSKTETIFDAANRPYGSPSFGMALFEFEPMFQRQMVFPVSVWSMVMSDGVIFSLQSDHLTNTYPPLFLPLN